MSLLWLAPAALAGLVLVAVPIAIHLLARQQGRRLEYPSLRFLRQSQLAAFRRRAIQDGLLLICRAAIISMAVLALAGPVMRTASRTAAYANRLVRAVIVLPGADVTEARRAAGDAFVSQVFERSDVADAIADAQRWLGEQPPAAREVVFIGGLRRGDLARGQLEALPATTGIRFVAVTTASASRDLTFPVLLAGRSLGEGGAMRDGALVVLDRRVRLDDDQTTVSEGVMRAAAADSVRILAAPADQPLADAALRAAIGAGVSWPDPSRRMVIAWAGADESTLPRMLPGATVVRMDRPLPPSSAASAVAAAITRLTVTDANRPEPVRIGDADLTAWSRPPGAPPAEAPPADEGDRRWLWALALALLAIEHGLRRSTPARPAAQPAAEARGA